MNHKLLNQFDFNEWVNKMELNANDSFYIQEEIDKKSDNSCYIPALGEDLTDIFSYQDCIKEASEWLEDSENAEAAA